MRRILLSILSTFSTLLLVLPSYSQTPPPSNLTVNTVTATSSMTTPSITLGNGTGPAIAMPANTPSTNAVLGIQSVTQTKTRAVIQTQWVKGFSGTRKAGSCLFTIQNGIITAVTGC